MSEHAFRFGRHQHLVGVLSRPSSAATPPGFAVIVLNAGVVHRIGPFRMTVELARELAAAGHPTLRFDLSTIGDSGGTADAASREAQVVADVEDAMTLAQAQTGCTRFVLIGLCSGAQNAHIAARHDPRVIGAVFMDGYGYRTGGYYLRYYAPRVLDPRRLAAALWRRLRRISLPKAAPAPPGFAVAVPPLEQTQAELSAMLGRGQHLLFIYTGGAVGYFNHVRQFGECFGAMARDPHVSVELFAEADHTYILAGDRVKLRARIKDWLARSF
jgi:pimeloyl-ACP methyl ester carboxylesterase